MDLGYVIALNPVLIGKVEFATPLSIPSSRTAVLSEAVSEIPTGYDNFYDTFSKSTFASMTKVDDNLSKLLRRSDKSHYLRDECGDTVSEIMMPLVLTRNGQSGLRIPIGLWATNSVGATFTPIQK